MNKAFLQRLLSYTVLALFCVGCASIGSVDSDGETSGRGGSGGGRGASVSGGGPRVVVGSELDRSKFDQWIGQIKPSLSEPQIEKKFVPDRVDPSGRRYTTSHWIYFIKRPSKWEEE